MLPMLVIGMMAAVGWLGCWLVEVGCCLPSSVGRLLLVLSIVAALLLVVGWYCWLKLPIAVMIESLSIDIGQSSRSAIRGEWFGRWYLVVMILLSKISVAMAMVWWWFRDWP